MKIYIDRIQRGVGQGGFHTCNITAVVPSLPIFPDKNIPFEFAFDCGTRSRGPQKTPIADFLNKHIQAYEPAEGIVDALFISHLDIDHYNGAERLCKSKKVSRIFLPYFTVDELILTAIWELTVADVSTTITAAYLNSLAEIARGNRFLFGVPVTVIGAPGAQIRDPQSTQQFTGRLIAVHVLADGSEEAIGENLPSGATIGLRTDTQRLPWILRPWTYKQSSDAQKTIKDAINSIPELNGLNLEKNDIQDSHIAAIKANKDTIRATCSQAIIAAGGMYAADHNAVSLCLYSGPQPRILSPYRAKYVYRGSAEPLLQHDPTGWIATGDSLLSKYWKEFRSVFADVLGNVGTYVVPHHGADHNHSPEFIDSIAGRLAVICARSNSKDHPGEAVLNCLHEVNDISAKVDEYSTYGLKEIVLFEGGSI